MNELIKVIETTQLNKNPISLSDILVEKNLNISTNEKGTDKGDFHCYIDLFYEMEFGRLRFQKNRLLEIGVRSGASLALWANYFPDIEIYGFDIEAIGSPHGPVQEYLDYPCIKYFQKDAYSYESASLVTGKFTILIDDGPHSLKSQMLFLSLYLDKLDINGILIIEDILRPYRDSLALIRSLPKGGKYTFEIYNFEKLKSGGGFLFVVKHNTLNTSIIGKTIYVFFHAFIELFIVFIRRMKRGDFSIRDRRKE